MQKQPLENVLPEQQTPTQPKHATNTTQTRPKRDPKPTQTRPKHNPNNTQTPPRHNPNNTQTPPKHEPKTTQTPTPPKTKPKPNPNPARSQPGARRALGEACARGAHLTGQRRPDLGDRCCPSGATTAEPSPQARAHPARFSRSSAGSSRKSLHTSGESHLRVRVQPPELGSTLVSW